MLSRNAVLSIIENNFYDELTEYVAECVTRLEFEELDELFELSVDYAELDTVDQLRVSDLESEEEEDGEIISGMLEAEVTLDGYAYWDGENDFVGTAMQIFGFAFSFYVDGKTYSDFELVYEY